MAKKLGKFERLAAEQREEFQAGQEEAARGEFGEPTDRLGDFLKWQREQEQPEPPGQDLGPDL